MKLNNEKAIKKEIAKLDKEIVTLYQVTNASRGHAIKYREGYRDALVKVLTNMDSFLPSDQSAVKYLDKLLEQGLIGDNW